MLHLSKIHIKFDETIIENGILNIPRGKLVALTGPSGSGKTTLLYCIGLISSNQSYEYRLDGNIIDLTSDSEKGDVRKTKIGYVFQENNLNRNLTVLENVRMSASLAGADTGISNVSKLLAQVGLENSENQYPSALSGGEQQRAAIACVLAKNPELIIADEPTSAMDEENTNIILMLLREIANQGKMVVIATHAPEVVERCDVVYDIQDKKSVLVRGEEYITDKNKKETKLKEKRKLRWPFFFRYQIKAGKKGRVLKNITMVICSLSIAFTALSTGFISGFAEQQRQNFKAVSDRELVVVNQSDPVYGNGVADDLTVSLKQGQIEQLQNLKGVESYGPFVLFQSYSSLTEKGLEISYEDQQYKESPLNSFYRYISFNSNSKKYGKIGFCNTEIEGEKNDLPDDIIEGYYWLESYFTYESMDLKCRIINYSVKPNEGVYIPEGLMRILNINDDDLNGLELTMDLSIPVKRVNTVATGFTQSNEEFKYSISSDWCIDQQITLPVRGILDENVVNAVKSIPIYAPSKIMVSHINKNKLDGDLPEIFYERAGWESSDVEDVYDWRPWAYYLSIEDVSLIEQVKKDVKRIDDNFLVFHEYQDYEAIVESVDNAQSVVLFTSLAILAVVLFLMAIIYMGIIDKRKFEFAMLKANGMTKKEVRKLVLSEMGVQVVGTFLVSLLLAWVLVTVLPYFIAGFQFNWQTVLWVAVISVVSIILPSIIALVFANKYEPDKIMRN